MQALSALGPGLILENGFFGARWVDQAKQNGFAHYALSSPSDQPIDPAAVAAFLDAHPDIRWCFYVSHETRMGLVNPMVELGHGPGHDIDLFLDLVPEPFREGGGLPDHGSELIEGGRGYGFLPVDEDEEYHDAQQDSLDGELDEKQRPQRVE